VFFLYIISSESVGHCFVGEIVGAEVTGFTNTVGADDGPVVGDIVGLFDGPLLGAELGELLGFTEGDKVGLALGFAEGEEEGRELGLELGVPEGDGLGAELGEALGDTLGFDDGTLVGFAEGVSLSLSTSSNTVGADVGVPVVIGAEVGRYRYVVYSSGAPEACSTTIPGATVL